MKKRIERRGLLLRLAENQSGSATIQSALLFGAIALAVTVLAVPVLDNAAATYAENRALGIDRVFTGAIEKPETKTYTIQKSVLD